MGANMANITKIKASDDKAPKKAEEKASAKKTKKVVAKPEENKKELNKKSVKKADKETAKVEVKKSSRKEKRELKKRAKAEAKANKPEKRIPVISYIKDSFHEIRQVRWPNRKETWKLTLSVIVYVVVIALFITLLDAGLEILMKNILNLGN